LLVVWRKLILPHNASSYGFNKVEDIERVG